MRWFQESTDLEKAKERSLQKPLTEIGKKTQTK